jgi:hypothetical protein
VANEKTALAAGTLDPDEASATGFWPDAMIQDTEAVLDRFESDVVELVVHGTEAVPDTAVFEVIRRIVMDLNAVDARHDGPYETGEREQLCAYIENTLERAGTDVDALAARHRMTRHEITDEWRQW